MRLGQKKIYDKAYRCEVPRIGRGFPEILKSGYESPIDTGGFLSNTNLDCQAKSGGLTKPAGPGG
jgi:hypothetical protein